MRILLLNPPHSAIGSRIPIEHLPPLGLLCLGGPLLDAGHQVRLFDAEFGPKSLADILAYVTGYKPDAILIGHSGSTSAHPVVATITRAIRMAHPGIWIIYGGVFPTFHWRDIMDQEPQIDLIVRGEGEETIVRLINAIETGTPLGNVPGIVYRVANESHPDEPGQPMATGPARLIENLDRYRVGWELIDHARYSYWDNRRAVVAQFSRGCPHRCNYCGQREFWGRWRHRDPVTFAAELAWLHREHGVEVVNFADENPTASRSAWRAFLEALIAQKVPLILVGSTRSDDIVRDADILHLYKKAGVERFLLGMESTDERTLDKIQKDSSESIDREAIRLLRRNNILSMVAYATGFQEETDADYWRTLRKIISYDPDQIQALYVTPHRWTPIAQTESKRRVIQMDLRKWDYKHQVLASKHMPPWRILLWTKLIEAAVQLRPKSLWRVLAHPDPGLRQAMRWYYQIGRKVWPYELWNFLFHDHRISTGPTLGEFWNENARLAPGMPVISLSPSNPMPYDERHELACHQTV
jgi:anaerobic magnesium-protoporphyrin IX monomethyl ester cyclase